VLNVCCWVVVVERVSECERALGCMGVQIAHFNVLFDLVSFSFTRFASSVSLFYLHISLFFLSHHTCTMIHWYIHRPYVHRTYILQFTHPHSLTLEQCSTHTSSSPNFKIRSGSRRRYTPPWLSPKKSTLWNRFHTALSTLVSFLPRAMGPI